MSSNIWLYYVFPLATAILFIFGGWRAFRHFARGDRDSRRNKYSKKEGCAGISLMALGGALGLAILLTSPTPRQRQRIFDHILHTPPEQISRFVIKPGDADQYRPLTKSEVVIDDLARIRQISEILRAATEVSPNHPHSKWTARIEMVTKDGSFYFGVDATVPGDPNGTLVNPKYKPLGGGWNLGDVRADGLDTILEDAAHVAKAR
jgi:hypothetical protein